MAGTGGIIAVVATLIDTVAPLIGVNIPTGSAVAALTAAAQVAGFVLLVWGQLRRKDLTWGIFRKTV